MKGNLELASVDFWRRASAETIHLPPKAERSEVIPSKNEGQTSVKEKKKSTSVSNGGLSVTNRSEVRVLAGEPV